ncbi:MAG: hypothetical protein ACLTYW_01490 [Collinsella sp.]
MPQLVWPRCARPPGSRRQGESTGSTAERFAKRVVADMAQRREDRTAREAEARALEGVAQAQPKKKKSTGAKRSRVTKSAQGIKVSMPSKKKK